MIQLDERQHTLACMEVWGTNRSVIRTVELPELTAWVYSKPAGGEDGGDVHYLSICGQSVLSRVVLADVSGHGAQVSGSAKLLHALMREHINTWDQTEFVRELNKSFRGCVARGKYATAVILGILRDTGETAFTSAGHLPPLWYCSKNKTWGWLDERSECKPDRAQPVRDERSECKPDRAQPVRDDDACDRNCGVEGLPVGLIQGTTYRQTLIQVQPEDILVLYTDGVTEAQDGFGDMLGRDRLMTWARMAPTDSPSSAGQFLLRRLSEFRRDNFTDDETIITIQKR
jgi:sigma-B regulation protein RsbU (phosphoserine phosphatase)